jgi:hypothetical protein
MYDNDLQRPLHLDYRTSNAVKPPTARRPLDWLAGQSSFQDLSLQAGRLAELQELLNLCAPVKGLKVKALDQAILVVSAPNASIAAKFRQFEPSVLRTLTERGWKVSRIRVRPQLDPQGDSRTVAVAAARRAVPEAGLRAMEQLLRSGIDGPLEKAIAHFVLTRRAAKS